MPPITDSRRARFKFSAVHLLDEQDRGIEVLDRMALDESSVAYPRLQVRGTLRQCGNTILNHGVGHSGRKRRLDMRIGCGDCRPAVDANSSGRASAAMQVSISTSGRHAGSGAGAAPTCSIIVGIVLYVNKTTPFILKWHTIA